jgi:hypothetical protein
MDEIKKVFPARCKRKDCWIPKWFEKPVFHWMYMLYMKPRPKDCINERDCFMIFAKRYKSLLRRRLDFTGSTDTMFYVYYGNPKKDQSKYDTQNIWDKESP